MNEVLPETAQEVDQDGNCVDQLDKVDGSRVQFVGVTQQHHDALPCG